MTVLCAAEFSLGSSSCSDVYCRALGALAGAGGGEGYSSEVFTAFTDCSACALAGLRLHRPSHTVRASSSCFKHDAASFTQRLRAERIAAAAVAGGQRSNAAQFGFGRMCQGVRVALYRGNLELTRIRRSSWFMSSVYGAAGTAKVS